MSNRNKRSSRSKGYNAHSPDLRPPTALQRYCKALQRYWKAFSSILAALAALTVVLTFLSNRTPEFRGPVGESAPASRSTALGEFLVDHNKERIVLHIYSALGEGAKLDRDATTGDYKLTLGENCRPIELCLVYITIRPTALGDTGITQRVQTDVAVDGAFVVQNVDTHQSYSAWLRVLAPT